MAGEDRVVTGFGGQRGDHLLPACDVVVAQVEVDVVVDEVLRHQDALLGELDEECVGGLTTGDGLEDERDPVDDLGARDELHGRREVGDRDDQAGGQPAVPAR